MVMAMNKQTERKQNLRKIVETLRLHGPVPQARLKEQCNLQASTVSYLVNDLRQKNLIVEVGKESTQGRVGKPGNMIGLNNQEATFLGIYVEDDCLYTYLVGIDGTTLGSDSVAYAPENVESMIYKTIGGQLAEHTNIRGIGIAIKAVVYKDGTIRSGSRNHTTAGESGWNLLDLPEHLRQAFPNIPIVVENDANSAAQLYRYEHKCDDFVLYVLNDIPFGIGCGLVMDGNLYRGKQGAAGEFFLKNFNSQKAQQRFEQKACTLRNILSAILPHMLQTAYLLDTERFVLTGSLFAGISQEEVEKAETYLKEVPVPVVFDYGKTQCLNPGKGAALMAINRYIGDLLEEVAKR